MKDHRGLEISSDNPESLDIFESALAQLNVYRNDPVAIIDEALVNDPDFIMGHILRAQVNLTLWESGAIPEIQSSLEKLHGLERQANERERKHVEALKAWVAGDWNLMRSRLDLLLADYPRDLLALQVGHISDFFLGDRDNLRGRVERVAPAWSGDDSAYGVLLGMHSFGLEECGAYSQAEDVGREALEREPTDCWAQHAVAHVLEMQSRQAEGIEFMESRKQHWAQEDNGFSYHNWWHTAIYNLDQDRFARALEIYDDGIRPEPLDVQMAMLDAAALLWRMTLRGLDTGERWEELAATYEDDGEDGFYAFNDMHAVMAFAATARGAASASRLAAMEARATGDGAAAMIAREVGLPIARAIAAFGREDYDAAVDLLMPVRYRAHIFGGSHAQRDIVHRTLIEAAFRANRRTLAKALTSERLAQKPDCPFSQSLNKRAQDNVVH